MPANHTPGPWHVQPIGRQGYIEADGPKFICDMQADVCSAPADVAEMEANAAFIVKACNCHEELVGAAEDALQSLKRLPDRAGAWRVTCIMQLEAALAKAKAKGQP